MKLNVQTCTIFFMDTHIQRKNMYENVKCQIQDTDFLREGKVRRGGNQNGYKGGFHYVYKYLFLTTFLRLGDGFQSACIL